MDAPTAIAGTLSLVCAAIHGVAGDRFLRTVSDDAFPSNAFGGPTDSKVVTRVAWHMVTMTFVIAGVALLVVGIADTTRSSIGILYLAGAPYTGYGVFTVSVTLMRKGVRGLFRHPGPLGLSATALFIWWGAAIAT